MRSSRLMWFLGAFVLATAAPSVAWWFLADRAASAEELAAKAELARLGALVVMDPQRRHVAGVNLATLRTPADLDPAVQLLKALPQISSLNADGTAFGDTQAATIAPLTSLQDLVLSHTAISDASVEHLQGLSNLKSLHLADTPITNAVLPALGRLTSLGVLDISGTRITGSFEPLRQLSDLQWLAARRLTLDAAALATLAECGGLQRISLNNTKVPQEALDSLAKQRPELAIDR